MSADTPNQQPAAEGSRAESLGATEPLVTPEEASNAPLPTAEPAPVADRSLGDPTLDKIQARAGSKEPTIEDALAIVHEEQPATESAPTLADTEEVAETAESVEQATVTERSDQLAKSDQSLEEAVADQSQQTVEPAKE